MMFGDVRVVDRVAASIASLPRVGHDGLKPDKPDKEVKMVLKEPHARAA